MAHLPGPRSTHNLVSDHIFGHLPKKKRSSALTAHCGQINSSTSSFYIEYVTEKKKTQYELVTIPDLPPPLLLPPPPPGLGRFSAK